MADTVTEMFWLHNLLPDMVSTVQVLHNLLPARNKPESNINVFAF